LNRDAGAGRFSGDVLVAKDGKTIFTRAYGLADRARKIPNTLETKFRVGSMDKMFTATAILQLVQSGKVDLNAPLIRYLPNYPNETLASKVTIDDLLTHTGGTGDIFGPAFDEHRLQLRTLDDYVSLYGKRPLKFEPGSRFDYSNYGFILLGVVIQNVSGQSYYDYVRSHIFDPAGMTSTGFAPENEMVASRSVGYTRVNGPLQLTNGPLQPNTDTLPYRGTSAGGGYSTVADLLRFANALDAGRLLDASYTKLLTTGKVVMPESIPPDLSLYAYGFGDQTMNGTRCFGHSGGAPGMSGDLKICPVPNYVTAVLANVDPPAADDISGFVVNRLPLH
jgi:CubicO group peptidase (beta-lactamase class C family)